MTKVLASRKEGLIMLELLEKLASKLEAAEPTAHCFIDKWNCQIVVKFDKRQDTEIALLTPYAQGQVKKGRLDKDIYSDMVFEIKRIANYSI